ncbi:MAG: glycogen-debranching protein, partial [Roseiflexaceae bacterium]|nr:glycogen-debranching protein [Roseiflexaceae bacterium]
MEGPHTARATHRWHLEEGAPAPLGASWDEYAQSYNFALYSRHATGVTLLLWSADNLVTPCYKLVFDHFRNKSGYVWHCRVTLDQAAGALYYAYRVDGPHEPRLGHRFNQQKLLLDPYAPAVFFPPNYSRIAAARPGPNDGMAPLGVLPP